jgi:hypothetical protein
VREFFVEAFHPIFSSKRDFYWIHFIQISCPRETPSWKPFIQFSLLRRDFCVDAFHPIFSSKERFLCGCLSSNFLF